MEEVEATCQRHKGGSNFVRDRKHSRGIENGPIFGKKILKCPVCIRVFTGVKRGCLNRGEGHLGESKEAALSSPHPQL